jgi:hypothetical protein
MHVFYWFDMFGSRPIRSSYQPIGNIHSGSPLINPVDKVVVVSTLSINAKVWPGIINMVYPDVGDKIEISIAHDHLSKHFGTVIYVDGQLLPL